MNENSCVRQSPSSTYSLGPFTLLLQKRWTSGLENTEGQTAAVKFEMQDLRQEN